MTHRRATLWSLAGVLVASIALAAASAPPAHAQEEPRFRVLVFTKTAAFRHDSIPAGIAADPGARRGERLRRRRDRGRRRVQRREPRAVRRRDLALHHRRRARRRPSRRRSSATSRPAAATPASTRPPTPSTTGPGTASWSARTSARHPAIQQATVKVADHVHPSTAHLPDPLDPHRRVVQLPTNPRGTVHVLAALDEASYTPGGRDGLRPPDRVVPGLRRRPLLVHRRRPHRVESYSEPVFRQHLLGGIETAAGATPADCGATTVRQLREGRARPATPATRWSWTSPPDGRVFFVERGGDVKIYKPAPSTTVTAGHARRLHRPARTACWASRSTPTFATNHWLYLFYSLPARRRARRRPGATTCGPAPLALHGHRRHARPGLGEGPARVPDPARRVLPLVRLAWTSTPRATCTWPPATTRTRTASSGYTPIDERAGRSTLDAQRTSANTNDLRGKVLRIHPEADGDLHRPGRQPLRAGRDGHAARDLRHGLPQPVPDDRRPGDRLGVLRRLRARRQTARTRPAARRATSSGTRSRSRGNYGWPYCHGEPVRLQRLQLRDRRRPAPGSTAPNPGQRLAEQHRPDQAAAVPRRRTSGTRTAPSAEFPELGTGCGVPDGGPGLPLRRRARLRAQVPGVLRRHAVLLRVGPQLSSGSSSSTTSGDLLDIDPVHAGRDVHRARWT